MANNTFKYDTIFSFKSIIIKQKNLSDALSFINCRKWPNLNNNHLISKLDSDYKELINHTINYLFLKENKKKLKEKKISSKKFQTSLDYLLTKKIEIFQKNYEASNPFDRKDCLERWDILTYKRDDVVNVFSKSYEEYFNN